MDSKHIEMNSEIIFLTKGLKEIKKIVEKQKKNVLEEEREGTDAQNKQIFTDISLQAIDSFGEKPFKRKVTRIESQIKNNNWITFEKTSDKSHVTHDSLDDRPKKRFICVLKPSVVKEVKKAVKVIPESQPIKRQKTYDVIKVREFIRKQKIQRKALKALNSLKVDPKMIIKSDIKSHVKRVDKQKQKPKENPIKEPNVSHVTEEEVKEVIPVSNDVINAENDVIKDDNHVIEVVDPPADNVIPEESHVSDSSEPIVSRVDVKSVISRALSSVPDWETLVERVFHKTFSEDVFRLTSDLSDVSDDDTEDDVVSELTTEEVFSSADRHSLLATFCRRIHALGPNEDLIRAEDHSGTAFQKFLFDFSKEIVLKEFRLKPEVDGPEIILTVPLRLQRRVWPQSSEEMVEYVTKRAEELMNLRENSSKDIRSQKLMAFCRQNRKKDFIDSVLHREMAEEDPLWTHFQTEEKVIKEKVSELLLKDLICEALGEWKRLT